MFVEPLEPSEFCQRWVPEKMGKYPGEYGYRKVCCRFLAQVSGYEESTTNNWLKQPSQASTLVKRYLRLLDVLWQIEKILPESQNE